MISARETLVLARSFAALRTLLSIVPPSSGGAVQGRQRMRRLSNFLFLLAAVVVGLSVLFYLYVLGMACAFITSGSPCRIRLPWQLGYEDFLYLVLLPTIFVIGLVGTAGALRRNRG